MNLNYPVYIPTKWPDVRLQIVQADPVGAAQRLRDLMDAGHDDATALCAYIVLMGVHRTPPDPAAAIKLLNERIGCRGNGYVEFVRAWALYDLGHYQDALRCMSTSANTGFLPGLLGLGQLLAGSSNLSREQSRTAEELLVQARRNGHVAATTVIANLWGTGTRGVLRRLLSIPLFAFAGIRFYQTAGRSWMEINALYRTLSRKRPLWD